MSQAEIKVWQTSEVGNNYPGLKNEIVDLIQDTFSHWSNVSATVSAEASEPTAPSQEVADSGSGYACFGDQIQWDNLLEWWQSFATSCYSNLAADSNLLITKGNADPDQPGPTGKGFIGGQFAVVEHGPLVSSNWNFYGTYNSNNYDYRLAMNAVHEVGHNLDLEHRDGRLDVRSDDDIQETPMTNRYGPIAISEQWNLNCDQYTPTGESDYWTKNDFSTCEKSRSYL